MQWRLAAAWLLSCCLLCAQSARYTFAVIADPQVGWKEEKADLERLARTVDAVNALPSQSRPDFVVLLGDLVNDASSSAQWSSFETVRKRLKVPVHWVPGNHDPAPAEGKDRFAFEHKGCLFVGLNSNLWLAKDQDAAARQFSWLEQRLGRERSPRLTFVFQHHPLFQVAPEEKDDYFNTPLIWREKLLPLLSSHNVTAVFSGHAHRNRTAWFRGMAQLVIPSSLYNFDSVPPGYALVEVHATRFSSRYVALE